MEVLISHPSSYLTDHDLNGDGLAAYEIIFNLAQMGHTVHVLVEDINIKKPFPSNVITYPLVISKRFPTLRPLLWIIKSFWVSYSIIKKNKIEIIHQLNPAERGYSVLHLLFRKPLIVGPINFQWDKSSDTKSFKSSLLGKISNLIVESIQNICHRILLNYSTSILVSTKAALADSLLLKNEKKVFIVPFGVNNNIFYPNEYVATKCNVDILFVGSLTIRKGIFDLISSFSTLFNEFPYIRLLIIGDGEEKSNLENQIKSLSCKSAILFLGKCTRDVIANYMRNSDIYVISSYGEPFGLSVIEAMSCGLPIIGTNRGGVFHLLSNAGALMYSPGDVEMLTKQLAILISSSEMRNKLSSENISISREYYWNSVMLKLVNVYEKCINSNSF